MTLQRAFLRASLLLLLRSLALLCGAFFRLRSWLPAAARGWRSRAASSRTRGWAGAGLSVRVCLESGLDCLRRLWPAAVAPGFPGGVFAGGRLGRGWALRSRAPGIRPGRRECRSSGKRSCSRANASFAEFRRRRGGRAPRWGETRFVSPPKISPAAGWTGAWIAVRCMRGGRLSWPGSCRTNFGVTLQERQNAKALRSRPSRPRFSVACGRDPSPRPPCRSRDDAPPPPAAPADGQQRRRQKQFIGRNCGPHRHRRDPSQPV